MDTYNSQKEKNIRAVTKEKTPVNTKGSPLMGKPLSGNPNNKITKQPDKKQSQATRVPEGPFVDATRRYIKKNPQLGNFLDNATVAVGKVSNKLKTGQTIDQLAKKEIQGIIDESLSKAQEDYAVRKIEGLPASQYPVDHPLHERNVTPLSLSLHNSGKTREEALNSLDSLGFAENELYRENKRDINRYFDYFDGVEPESPISGQGSVSVGPDRLSQSLPEYNPSSIPEGTAPISAMSFEEAQTQGNIPSVPDQTIPIAQDIQQGVNIGTPEDQFNLGLSQQQGGPQYEAERDARRNSTGALTAYDGSAEAKLSNLANYGDHMQPSGYSSQAGTTGNQGQAKSASTPERRVPSQWGDTGVRRSTDPNTNVMRGSPNTGYDAASDPRNPKNFKNKNAELASFDVAGTLSGVAESVGDVTISSDPFNKEGKRDEGKELRDVLKDTLKRDHKTSSKKKNSGQFLAPKETTTVEGSNDAEIKKNDAKAGVEEKVINSAKQTIEEQKAAADEAEAVKNKAAEEAIYTESGGEGKPVKGDEEARESLLRWGESVGLDDPTNLEEPQEEADPYAGMSPGTKKLMEDWDKQQEQIKQGFSDGQDSVEAEQEQEDWSIDADYVKAVGYFLFGLAASGGNPFFAFMYANEGFRMDRATSARVKMSPELLKTNTQASVHTFIQSGDSKDLIPKSKLELQSEQARLAKIKADRYASDQDFDQAYKTATLKLRAGELAQKNAETQNPTEYYDTLKELYSGGTKGRASVWRGAKALASVQGAMSNRFWGINHGAYIRNPETGVNDWKRYGMTGIPGDAYGLTAADSYMRLLHDNGARFFFDDPAEIGDSASIGAEMMKKIGENIQGEAQQASARRALADEISFIGAITDNKNMTKARWLELRNYYFPSTMDTPAAIAQQAARRQADLMLYNLAAEHQGFEQFDQKSRSRIAAFNKDFIVADWKIDENGQSVYKLAGPAIDHLANNHNIEVKENEWVNYADLVTGVTTSGREEYFDSEDRKEKVLAAAKKAALADQEKRLKI